MSQLDDLLGGPLGGGQGGRGGLEDILGQLTGKPQAGVGQSNATVGRWRDRRRTASADRRIPATRWSEQGPLGAPTTESELTGDIVGGYRAERTEPVSSTQVEQAVGPEEIDAIAGSFGLSREPAANAVTVVLPRVVDQMSPQGELPPENELDDLFGRLAQMGR